MAFTENCLPGDIGYSSEDVEKKLEDQFHLAQRWGCVLLLDEADVFLTKRTVRMPQVFRTFHEACPAADLLIIER